MHFTYDNLMEKSNNIMAKLKSGSIPNTAAGQAECLLGMSAAHATDIVDISRDIGSELDFTEKTWDNLRQVVVSAFMIFAKEGKKSSTALREQVSKKLGPYLLFYAFNEAETSGFTPQLIFNGSYYTLEITDPLSNAVRKIDTLWSATNYLSHHVIFDKRQGIFIAEDLQELQREISV